MKLVLTQHHLTHYDYTKRENRKPMAYTIALIFVYFLKIIRYMMQDRYYCYTDDLNNKMSEPPTKIVKLDSVFG